MISNDQVTLIDVTIKHVTKNEKNKHRGNANRTKIAEYCKINISEENGNRKRTGITQQKSKTKTD